MGRSFAPNTFSPWLWTTKATPQSITVAKLYHKQEARTLEKPHLGTSTMAIQLLLSLLFFPSSLSSSASSNIISNVAQVLSNFGIVSMSLTLQYAPQTLIPKTQNLTIFSPSDTIFAKSSQPSLALLRFHFSPQSLPPSFLDSLHFGSKITTFSPTHSLIVTSSPSNDQFSLNGVKIGTKPVYDDGFLIIYKIDKFFDPIFKVSKHGCVRAYNMFRNTSSFEKASEALRLIMPCKVPGKDLVNWDKRMVLETYLEGFDITVTKSGANVMINGVKVIARDLFQSDWLVVHGLSRGVSREKAGNVAVVNSNFNKVLLATACCLFLSLRFC
ncbi:hypothetical protein DITRI_Ditri12bG0040900 [Diplodiscus trichospermus]